MIMRTTSLWTLCLNRGGAARCRSNEVILSSQSLSGIRSPFSKLESFILTEVRVMDTGLIFDRGPHMLTEQILVRIHSPLLALVLKYLFRDKFNFWF